MAEERTTSSTGGVKGVKLQRLDLIPVGPLLELAEHYGVGASKYADHNYRNGYEWSKSYSALMRHLLAFWAGFDYDVCSNDPTGCKRTDTNGRPFVAIREDACFNHTGSHHMVAVAWHAFALLEFKDTYPEHDDRYATMLARAQAEAETDAGVEPEASYAKGWLEDYDAAFRPFDTADLEPFQDRINEMVKRFLEGPIVIGWTDPEVPTQSARAVATEAVNEALNRRD